MRSKLLLLIFVLCTTLQASSQDSGKLIWKPANSDFSPELQKATKAKAAADLALEGALAVPRAAYETFLRSLHKSESDANLMILKLRIAEAGALSEVCFWLAPLPSGGILRIRRGAIPIDYDYSNLAAQKSLEHEDSIGAAKIGDQVMYRTKFDVPDGEGVAIILPLICTSPVGITIGGVVISIVRQRQGVNQGHVNAGSIKPTVIEVEGRVELAANLWYVVSSEQEIQGGNLRFESKGIFASKETMFRRRQ